MLVRYKELIFNPEEVQSIELDHEFLKVRIKKGSYFAVLRNATKEDFDHVWALITRRPENVNWNV